MKKKIGWELDRCEVTRPLLPAPLICLRLQATLSSCILGNVDIRFWHVEEDNVWSKKGLILPHRFCDSTNVMGVLWWWCQGKSPCDVFVVDPFYIWSMSILNWRRERLRIWNLYRWSPQADIWISTRREKTCFSWYKKRGTSAPFGPYFKNKNTGCTVQKRKEFYKYSCRHSYVTPTWTGVAVSDTDKPTDLWFTHILYSVHKG